MSQKASHSQSQPSHPPGVAKSVEDDDEIDPFLSNDITVTAAIQLADEVIDTAFDHFYSRELSQHLIPFHTTSSFIFQTLARDVAFQLLDHDDGTGTGRGRRDEWTIWTPDEKPVKPSMCRWAPGGLKEILNVPQEWYLVKNGEHAQSEAR